MLFTYSVCTFILRKKIAFNMAGEHIRNIELSVPVLVVPIITKISLAWMQLPVSLLNFSYFSSSCIPTNMCTNESFVIRNIDIKLDIYKVPNLVKGLIAW